MKNSILRDFKTKMSEAVLCAFAVNILFRMNNNPTFASIKIPYLDALQVATDRFVKSCQEAADGSHLKVAEKRQIKFELVDELDKTAIHVQLIANGNEAIIIDSGYHVKRQGAGSEKKATLEPVSNLRVNSTAATGVVNLVYKSSRAARAHLVEMSTAENNWVLVATSSTSSAVVSGVPHRQEVQFRVYAIGSGQQKSAPCEAVRVYLL